jgi:hypothetical protein
MNYWERKYPVSATDCYYWYWGSKGKLENACMHKSHDRKQCTGKCTDYCNTHAQVIRNLASIHAPAQGATLAGKRKRIRRLK